MCTTGFGRSGGDCACTLCKSEQVSGEILRYVFSALVLITDKHRPQRLEMNVEWESICAFIHYVTMRFLFQVFTKQLWGEALKSIGAV